MEFKGHKYTKGIFWLPRKSEIDQSFLVDVNIPTPAYNHPVLILSHKPGGSGYLDMVDLVILTSSPKTDENGYIKSHYLPIAPSKKHPLTQVQLKLCGHQRLPRLIKCSYVCVEQMYTIPLDALQQYPWELPGGAYQLKIQADSFITVRTHVRHWMQPPEPCPADLDASCLLQETRFQGGNNAEAKSKADIESIELQLERCLKELQSLKMQMALETPAGGPSYCRPGDESDVSDGKNVDDGITSSPGTMTVTAAAELAENRL